MCAGLNLHMKHVNRYIRVCMHVTCVCMYMSGDDSGEKRVATIFEEVMF